MIRLKDITLKYGKDPNTTTALDKVSVDFSDKGLVVILGKEGSGKTSLMNVLGAISKPQEGTFFVDGEDMYPEKGGEQLQDAYRCSYISNILAGEKLIGYQTAEQNIGVPLKLAGYEAAQVNERVNEILKQAEMEDIAKVRAYELGGGQKQIINIARALCSDHKVLLADEPFADLDPEVRPIAIHLLREEAKEKLVVLATSDSEIADLYADRIITMADSAIVSDEIINDIADPALAKAKAPALEAAAATAPMAPVAPAASAAKKAPTASKALAIGTAGAVAAGAADAKEPAQAADAAKAADEKPKKQALRLDLAIGMAYTQLTTKKWRTFLNSLVGALAVMALGLMLLIGQGMDTIYNNVEGDIMDTAPVTLKATTLNIDAFTDSGQIKDLFTSSVDENVLKSLQGDQFATDNQVAPSIKPILPSISITKTNDLGAFKSYMDSHSSEFNPLTTAVEYTYNNVTPQVYRLTDNGSKALKMNTSLAEIGQFSQLTTAIMSGMTTSRWYQMPNGQRIREANYTLEAGSWPTQANEVALVLNNNHTVSDFTLYTLGMMDLNEMNNIIAAVERNETPENVTRVFSYNDAIGVEAKVLSNANLYRQLGTGVWVNDSSDNGFVVNQLNNAGQPVRITGVLRLKDGSNLGSGIAYTGALTDQLVQMAENTDIARQQKANPTTSVFTGQPFMDTSDSSQNSNSNNKQVGFNIASSSDATANASDSQGTQLGQIPLNAATYQLNDNSNNITTVAKGETAKVRFLDYNKEVLKEFTVEVGKSISASKVPANPTRDSDKNYDYYFIGWRNLTTGEVCVDNNKFPTVTKDVDYQAFFYADATHHFDPSTMTMAEMAAMLHISENKLWEYIWANVGVKELKELMKVSDDELLKRIMSCITAEQLAKALGVDPSIFSGIKISQLSAQELCTLVNMSSNQILDRIYATYGLEGFLNMLGVDIEDLEFDLDWLEQLLGFDIGGIISSIGSAFSADNIRTMLAQFSLDNPTDYKGAMNKLGIQDTNTPSSIAIYSPTYKDRVGVTNFIKKYNDQVADKEKTVSYTDAFSAIYNVMDAVSKVIGAIAAVALFCGLFMFTMMVVRTALGSLIKRRQEISILRAMGATRASVLKLFNAGSILEGVIAGVFGIILVTIISLVINGAVEKAAGLQDFLAFNPGVGVIMLLVSVVITFLAGLIPAIMAAKKDMEEYL